jgi:sarcosine/dimethylglycine N-methyltransferase
MVDILTYYDEHPINESSIRAALARDEKNLDELRPSDLFPYDQDHYGGLQAVIALAERAEFSADSKVLDVCSGMGGPARYISDRYGCHVVGLDLNESRALSALRLTNCVGLASSVEYICGNATSMPLTENAFTHVISQEAFLHIADKNSLFKNCRKVLFPRGRMVFTDWVASPDLSSHEQSVLRDGMAAAGIHQEGEYRQYILSAGFASVETEDLSQWWSEILRERFEMYRSRSEEAGEAFGLQRFTEFIEAYQVFVEVVEAGKLGGARFTAYC